METIHLRNNLNNSQENSTVRHQKKTHQFHISTELPFAFLFLFFSIFPIIENLTNTKRLKKNKTKQKKGGNMGIFLDVVQKLTISNVNQLRIK